MVSSRPSPRAKARNAPSIRSIWSMSSCIGRSISSPSSISASVSFIRVSGVRRSWLTPESIWVRCSIWRSRRARIVEEGGAGAAHLLGAGGAEGGGAALAEGLGRLGELADRADLVAQEHDGDRAEDDGDQHHQHQELVGVGDREPVARDDRLERALAEGRM